MSDLAANFYQKRRRTGGAIVTEAAIDERRTWFSQQEAARYAGVHEATIWRARKAGELQAGGVGRKVRIRRDELDRWLESGGPDQG